MYYYCRMSKLKWDYAYGDREYGTQKDWNQSIVTLINKLTNFEEATVTVPNKFKNIIESLEYYNEETNLIKDTSQVEFVESKKNFIYVNINNSIEVINYEDTKQHEMDFNKDGHVDCDLQDRLDEK